MGKRGRPARIIRCAKPAKCPKCGNRHFLIVIYGYPSNQVIDEIDKYDIKGCCLPPYKKVREKVAIIIIVQNQNMYAPTKIAD